MGFPVVHFEIGSKNAKKVAGFYNELLGWKSSEMGPQTHMFDTGVNEPGTIMGHIHDTEGKHPNYTVVYALVENLDASIAKAQRLGGSLAFPITEVPGMGQFAWIKDPEGNMFGLWKSAKP
jgi:predicted enzyme related to lactoylglutathione lyase